MSHKLKQYLHLHKHRLPADAPLKSIKRCFKKYPRKKNTEAHRLITMQAFLKQLKGWVECKVGTIIGTPYCVYVFMEMGAAVLYSRHEGKLKAEFSTLTPRNIMEMWKPYLCKNLTKMCALMDLNWDGKIEYARTFEEQRLHEERKRVERKKIQCI